MSGGAVEETMARMEDRFTLNLMVPRMETPAPAESARVTG
jgi:hypothetical protein